jgi:threonyl-tRNA synthetase
MRTSTHTWPRSRRRGSATTGGLGVQLDLFHLSDESPGSPFWHPKGMVIWNELEDLRRRENAKRGYSEVKTPLIYEKSVWETSGHWEKFRENMFLVLSDPNEEPHAGLKPMNCPGHMLLFGSRLRSYRDLPIRYAESSTLHRNELAGALHGLLRVRHVTQDDAHIFCTQEQVAEEIDGCIQFAKDLYALFDVVPARRALDEAGEPARSDDEWTSPRASSSARSSATASTTSSARARARSTGPKIDLHMTDVLGRSWQLGTIQLDAQMPTRFGLTYMGADNHEHPVFVVHRAFFGSVRALHRHPHRAFTPAPSPFWLAPVQVRLIPVGESHRRGRRVAARPRRRRGASASR